MFDAQDIWAHKRLTPVRAAPTMDTMVLEFGLSVAAYGQTLQVCLVQPQQCRTG